MEHSISIYSLRVHQHIQGAKRGDECHYKILSDINGKDLYDILKVYFESIEKDECEVEYNDGVAFNAVNMTYDPDAREIYGYIRKGNFGIKSDIYNLSKKSITYSKGKDEADLINHYIHFYVPEKENKAIMVCHTCGTSGVKSTFIDNFRDFFLHVTNLPIQTNPLSYAKAYNECLDSLTNVITVRKYSLPEDKADRVLKISKVMDATVSINIKDKSNRPKLLNFFDKDSDSYKLVEVFESEGSTVNVTVQLSSGKTRTFKVGKKQNLNHPNISIDEDSGVKMDQGFPELSSMHAWVCAIIEDMGKNGL